MALTVENANLVWQKVFIALDALGATPNVKESFRVLKQRLANAGKNKDLQFVAFSDLTGDTTIADVACTFYGAYAKKQATATDAYFKTADHATVCGAANGASMQDSIYMPDSAGECTLIFPKGRLQVTGITIASQTTAAGNTDSTTGDGPNGFFIIGA